MKPPNPHLWKRIEQVFQAAVEVPPSRREAFLDQACDGDGVLRLEVVNLLDADAEAEEFLETPALGEPPREDSEETTASTLLLATELTPCVERPSAVFSLNPGEVLSGRFRVLRFLAAGGMGEVYEGEDLELGGHLAIKTILRPLADDPSVMERFRREVHLARQVTHPSICRSFDIFHCTLERPSEAMQQVTFLTMELLRGETLRQRIKRQGPLTSAEGMPIVRQVAEGLAAAHEAGIVHRDLKSSNVFLVGDERRPRAVVTDFGLARFQHRGVPPVDPVSASGVAVAAGATDTGTFMGTPAYMAPEQLIGEEITPATDIYAFGVVMYEMATGELPFAEGEDPFRRLTRPAPDPRRRVEHLDAKWAEVIRRSLDRRPGHRFQNGRDLIRALEAHRQPKPFRLPWVAAAIVLLVLLVAGVWRITEAPRSVEEDAVVSLRPQNAEAARLFDEGLQRLRSLEVPRGRKLLAAATALEPEVPLIHRVLAEAWLLEGYEAEARKEARRSYELRGGLPRLERLRVEAFYYETRPRGQDSLKLAAEAYRTLFDEAPDLETGLHFASVLRRTGEAEKALAVLDEVRPPAPGDPRVELEEVRLAGRLHDPARLEAAAARGLAASSRLPWIEDRIHLALAEAWRAIGDREKAAAAARTAGACARKLEDEVTYLQSRFQLALLAGEGQEAKGLYEELFRGYRRLGHKTALMKLYSHLGVSAFGRGSFQDAADNFSQAVDIAREIDDWQLAWYLYNLGSTLQELDRLEAALGRYEEANTRAKAIDDRELLLSIQNNLAGVQRGLGRLDAALATYEQALRLVRDEGDSPGVASRLANLGALYLTRGDLAASEARYQEASNLEVDEAGVRAQVIQGLGYVALSRDELGKARGRFTAALNLRLKLGESHNVSEARVALADVALASGRADEAATLARQAAEELAELQSPDKELRAQIVLGQALVSQGRLAEARDALTRAGGLAAATSYPELGLQLGIVEARWRAASGEPDAAKLEAVLAQAQSIGFGEVALQARLALGETSLAAGDARGRADLEALAAEADEKGFALIARRAREAAGTLTALAGPQ